MTDRTTDRGVYVTTRQGTIFLLDPLTLAVKARAIFTVDPNLLPTFRTPGR